MLMGEIHALKRYKLNTWRNARATINFGGVNMIFFSQLSKNIYVVDRGHLIIHAAVCKMIIIINHCIIICLLYDMEFHHISLESK